MADKDKKSKVSKSFQDKTKGRSLPKGAKVQVETGGTPESIKKSMQSGSKRILSLKDGDSLMVAWLQEPQDWLRFSQHRVDTKGGQSVPCIGEDCEFDKHGNRPSKRAMINVYDRKTKTVKLFIANTEVVGDLLSKFGKRLTLLDRYYTLSREGEWTETKYHIEREDDKVPKRVKNLELLDGMVELNQWLDNYYGNAPDEEEEYDDNEEEDEDEEYEDEDEVDDEDEEEEEKPKKKKKKAKKVVEEEEEEDEEEEEEEEDDEEEVDDEEEEVDDEEDILPPKKKKKAKSTKKVKKEEEEEEKPKKKKKKGK